MDTYLVKKNKKKLLTTLSVTNSLLLNYYWLKKDDKKRFCFGVQQQEPGTIAVCSEAQIDEIIVVYSDATITKKNGKALRTFEPEAYEKNYFWNRYQSEKKIPDDYASFTPCELYLLGLELFWHGEDCLARSLAQKGIEKERQNEIEAIVKTMLNGMKEKEEDYVNLFDKNDVSIHERLADSITENIREKFRDESSYKEYKQSHKDLIEKIIGFQDIDLYTGTSAFFQKGRQDILNDKNLNFIEKEYALLQLEHKASGMLNESAGLLKDDEIMKLRLERDELAYELRNLKSNRQKKELSYAEYYLYSLIKDEEKLHAFNENGAAAIMPEIHFVHEGKINEIVSHIRARDEQTENIEVFIDIQGGSRTNGYETNAVLSILQNQQVGRELDDQDAREEIIIKKIVATDFNPRDNIWGHQIVDETDRYKISDLVSGMNAFINYGRADILKRYFDKVKLDAESITRKLLDKMIAMDESISICNVVQFENSFVEIKKILNGIDSECSQLSMEDRKYHADIMIEELKKDYGALLLGEKINFVKLIKWCLDKDFVQQAMTLIEAKLPCHIVDSGILYYCSNGEEQEVSKKMFGYMLELNKKERWKRKNVETYFIKYMDNMCIKEVFVNTSEDSKGEKKTFEESLRNLLQKNRIVKIGMPEAEWGKLQQLLSLYFEICEYRNGVNHANAKETLEEIKKKCEDCCEFYDTCTNLVDSSVSSVCLSIRTIDRHGKKWFVKKYLESDTFRNKQKNYFDDKLVKNLNELISQVNRIKVETKDSSMDKYIEENVWVNRLIEKGILGENAKKDTYFKISNNNNRKPNEKLMSACINKASLVCDIVSGK